MSDVVFKTFAIASLILAAFASIPAAIAAFVIFLTSGLAGSDGFVLRTVPVLVFVVVPIFLVIWFAIQYLRGKNYWHAISAIVIILFYILLFLNYFLPTFLDPAK